ncbi:DUF262 domain-containing protein [Methylomonas koyamae]|uniref:DUF262 domain-containing protein n=1 Tax=Methylomonas koyamae TaxID=702114 RepID=A0AA91DA83_9GAMM|nr:DUF262 domain-containing protein [Methylomonas koyamae]OAI23418.1 hypothetical protein A1356_01695 [Methylomonas koyamae]
MQPGKTSITLLFNAPTQYVIPVFQRGYVWTLEKQVAPLWADLSDRADDLIKRQEVQNTSAAHLLGTARKHFLGSLVLTPVVNSFGRVGAYEVIDGQQRTTTLHLLLIAFRDVSKRLGNAVLFQLLENLTKNPGPYNESSDHHKVWPTQAGRDEITFLNTAGGSDAVCKKYPLKVGKVRQERPLLVQTYLYLYHATLAYLHGVNLDDPISAETDTTYSDHLTHLIRHDEHIVELVADKDAIAQRAELLFMALQDHVQIMTLTLEAEDDPQVIFETLNARGEPLLASDLVRNFVFLEATRNGMPVGELYNKYWQDFDEQKDAAQKITSNRYWREKERQGRITNPRIDLFFFHYTILQRVAETKVGHVFQNYKDWWQRQARDLEVELAHIQKVSGWFKEFISPTGYSRTAEFARLIKALDVSTLTPVYLALRDFYEEDSPEFLQAISDLESYVVRRAVCGYTTKNYNRIFMRLLEILHEEKHTEEVATEEIIPLTPAQLLRSYLQKLGGHSQCWPSDQEFHDAWLSRAVYKEMRVGKVCALLRSIELASHTKKQEALAIPQTLTVEHVLPQAWESSGHYPISDMTDAQRIERNRTLHTFGNLTLLTQALNSSASNGPFHSTVDPSTGEVLEGKRRKIAANSLLKMNAYFQALAETSWEETAISTRAENLFIQALKVWNRPVAPA